MELTIRVPMPVAAPADGVQTALYSTRPRVNAGSGRPFDAGPIQSGERNMQRIRGWINANQAGSIFVQGWDVGTKAWVTIATIPVVSGTTLQVDQIIPPGDFQISATFATSPTTWEHSKWLLSGTADA